MMLQWPKGNTRLDLGLQAQRQVYRSGLDKCCDFRPKPVGGSRERSRSGAEISEYTG